MTEISAGPPVSPTEALPTAPVASQPAPEAPRVVLEDGNDVTDGIEPDEEEAPKAPRLKRRDLLEVSALLRRNKLDPSDMMAMGLGTQFLQEKKAGETKLRFQDWLDEEMPEGADEGEGEEDDPTEL